MGKVICSNCSKNLEIPPDERSGARIPCPNCGSTVRTFSAHFRSEIKLGGHLSALGKRKDKPIAFRESERNGRATSVDRNNDGSLNYSIIGSSPQGEEDTLTTCQSLIKVLNELGENWTEPIMGTGIVDCEAKDINSTSKQLYIQVTRAIVDKKLWQQLNKQGNFEEIRVSPRQLTTYILEAIKKKTNEIPQSIRNGLTLALDANLLPVLGFEDVVKNFIEQNGHWTKQLGFDSVWLVGPLPELISRLDLEP